MAETNPGAGTPEAGKDPTTIAGGDPKADEGKKADETGKAGDEGKKADDGKKGDTGTPDSKGSDEGKDGGKPTPPEKYELQRPEGGRVDDEIEKAVVDLAKQEGWSQEKAQEFLDAQNNALNARSEQFLEATSSDPDYGGDKLEETERLVRNALAKVRPEGHPRRAALLGLLNRTGYGNHIEIVSALADFGRLVSEDGPTGGSGGGTSEKTAEEMLYGTK